MSDQQKETNPPSESTPDTSPEPPPETMRSVARRVTRRWRFFSKMRTRLGDEFARPSNLIALVALLVAVYVLVQSRKPMVDAETANARWQAKFDQQVAASKAAFKHQEAKLDLMITQSELQLNTERLHRLGATNVSAQSQLIASAGRYEALLGEMESPSLFDEMILANALGALGNRERALEMLLSITDRYVAAEQWREASHTSDTAMMLSAGLDGEFEPAAERAEAIIDELHPIAARQFRTQIRAYTILHHARNARFDQATQAITDWQNAANPNQSDVYRMLEENLTEAQREALNEPLSELRKRLFS